MGKIGRPFPFASTLEARLKNVGFVDVVVETYKQPFGLWPKDKRLAYTFFLHDGHLIDRWARLKYAGAMALMMVCPPPIVKVRANLTLPKAGNWNRSVCVLIHIWKASY
jgi:hypothetical protein